jgi:hypothetical protein
MTALISPFSKPGGIPTSRIRNNTTLPAQSIAEKNVNLDENTAALVRLH